MKRLLIVAVVFVGCQACEPEDPDVIFVNPGHTTSGAAMIQTGCVVQRRIMEPGGLREWSMPHRRYTFEVVPSRPIPGGFSADVLWMHRTYHVLCSGDRNAWPIGQRITVSGVVEGCSMHDDMQVHDGDSIAIVGCVLVQDQ